MSNLTQAKPRLGTAPARAEQLQFLRFLAFWNVFLYHVEEWNFFGYAVTHAGKSSLSMFFALGGLVLGYACYGREVSPTPGNIARDLLKKARRFYPMYLLTMMIAMLSSDLPELVSTANWPGLQSYARDLGCYLLFLQSWIPYKIRSINGLSWYLSTTMFLSLFNLPFLWLLNKLNKSKYRWVLLGGVLCFVWGLNAVFCRVTREWDMYYWHLMFPPARMGEHLGGIVIGFAVRGLMERAREIPWEKLLFTALEVLAIWFWCSSLSRPGNYWMNHSVAWLVPNALLLAVFTFGRGYLSQCFRWKPLVWLGDISFECYLVHQMIIQKYVLHNYRETVPLYEQIFAFTFFMGLTIFAGAMLHRVPKKKECKAR